MTLFGRFSVKHILAPLVIGMPHQPHDVTAGVKIERARLARGLHVRFMRKLVTLAAVAGMATGYEVLPGREAAAGTRDNVIKSEFAGRQRRAAILASIAVAQQDILA